MKKFLPCLFVLAITSSCMTPKIALHGDGFREMPVKGRNGFFIKQKLSFGEYHTTSVRRSWTKETSSRRGISFGTPGMPGYENIVSMEYSRKKQTLNFEMTDSVNTAEVRCVTKFSTDELIIGNNENSLPNIIIDLARGMRSTNTFYIQVFINAEMKPWHLLLDNNALQSEPKTYTGKLVLDDMHFYSLVPVRQMLNKKGEAKNILFGSIGLDIRNIENRSVATVSFLDKGKVFLNTNDKKEAFVLSSVCAALLLQEQIGD